MKMDKQNEEKNRNEFNKEGPDPTKEAFFSDLGDIEEEINAEALELVRHALSLIESRYYDDSIEILRQAIGLYEQIDRNAEVEALNRKVSELYVLKEQNFKAQEEESKPDLVLYDQEISKDVDKERLSLQANELIHDGEQLVNQEKFENALDKYDEAIIIFQELNSQDDIERVNNLIEACYNKKADFLRREKEVISRVGKVSEPELKTPLSKEEEKAQRLRVFEEAKLKEKQFSEHAFILLGEATELLKIHQYDQALELYEKSTRLFQEINWVNESKKILNTIEQVKKDRENYLIELERLKKKAEIIEQKKKQESVALLEKAKVEEKIKLEEEAKKLRDISQRKQEEEQFKVELADLVNNAERIAREYEIGMKKAIKKGTLLEECVYPEIIKIYEDVRKRVIEIGWNDQALIYTQQIKHYYDLLEKDRKLRLIEIQKQKKEKEYKDLHKIKKEVKSVDIDVEKLKKIEEVKKKEETEFEYKKQMDNLVDRAEKLAREYDIAFKRAVKTGELDLESKYPKIIELYTLAREGAAKKGWNNDVAIYSTQIKKYNDLLEKENRVRDLEVKKAHEKKIFEEASKVEEISTIDVQKVKAYEINKSKRIEEEIFQKEISELVDNAERLARDYETYKRKALKKKELLKESPYLEIIEIYSKTRDRVYSRGWTDQAAMYGNQIKFYQEKLEKDKKLREIELEKIQKQEEFKKLQSLKEGGKLSGSDIEKLKQIEVKFKKEQEEENFEKEIDELVEAAEKEAREYELAIKRGQFEKECPYLKIAELYKRIREKVYARDWFEEAKLYINQIKSYQGKFEKDKKLRQLEAQKLEKQKEYEESLKISKEATSIKYQVPKEVEAKDKETEDLLNRAMNLINESENDVRSYELSIKKDILIIQSPYEKAISNYEQAKNIFQKIGWNEEAHRLINTINFYKDKKIKDDNLRVLEEEKLIKVKEEEKRRKLIPKEEVFVREMKVIEFEKIRKEATKGTDEIFNLINKAERFAQEYELKKKEGILKVEAPFEEIIEMYRSAKKKFEEVGWKDQADQLINTIKYYKERLNADNKLRALELGKMKKEEAEIQKQRIEAQLAKEAEVELLKQKMQSIELKKQQVQKYEAKKAQAFSFTDLAKRELNQNNFDKAIKYYKESEKIFAEINWLDGMKLVKDSISIINRKREKYEQEKVIAKLREGEKLKMEAQLELQISKAQDLKKLQQEQKRTEFMEIQRLKEQERGISEQAYRLLEEGTELKNNKRYDKAFEKYIMGRDLFQKIGWQHEVSRINNDLLLILKKEMKQTEKIKAYQQKKIEEEKELETLLEEAEIKRKELEKIRKEEKQKKREKVIEDEMELVNNIIKDFKYNEAILKLKKIIKKSGKVGKDKLIKQLNKQIEVLENASQVPLITIEDVDRNEDLIKFELSYKALDKAQISLSSNLFMRAISELNEANFNLKETKIGPKYIPIINEKINSYKKELGIKIAPEEEELEEEVGKKEEDLKDKIAARRIERKKKIRELMEKRD